jgi:hypothetical protein
MLGGIAVLLSALSLSSRARAEGYAVDATAAVGTGLEGADPGVGHLEWHRARTRIIAGFDLRSDEWEKESVGFRGFAEVERHASAGGEVRYTRWLGHSVGGWVFGTAVITPETLVGAGVGMTLTVPFGKRFGIAIEPSFAALPLGSDRAENGIVLWGSLSLGVRLGL